MSKYTPCSVSLFGSRTAELQVIIIFFVRKRNFRSIFIVRKRNCGTVGQVFSLCGSGIAELQVKYFPCAEAESRNFRLSIFLVGKRNCRTSGRVFSLCVSGIAEIQVIIFSYCRSRISSNAVFSLCGSGTTDRQIDR